MTRHPPTDAQTVAEQVAATFVHRRFPSLRPPAFLACPDDQSADACRVAIADAAKTKRVKTDVVDLGPDPPARLDQVTASLHDVNDRTHDDKHPWPMLLILEGFDWLEGSKNDGPTYPFRSRFQFDTEHLWLFMGRDWQRLRKMFGDRRLPLYRAAADITPGPWRTSSQTQQLETPEAL